MANIKQWCSNPDLKIRLEDSKGDFFELPDFFSLTDGEFNPVEIYASYIGLYINNMLGILSYFTSEFAKANQYEYDEPKKPAQNDTCSNLRYFTDYLKIQQSIYRAA